MQKLRYSARLHREIYVLLGYNFNRKTTCHHQGFRLKNCIAGVVMEKKSVEVSHGAGKFDFRLDNEIVVFVTKNFINPFCVSVCLLTDRLDFTLHIYQVFCKYLCYDLLNSSMNGTQMSIFCTTKILAVLQQIFKDRVAAICTDLCILAIRTRLK